MNTNTDNPITGQLLEALTLYQDESPSDTLLDKHGVGCPDFLGETGYGEPAKQALSHYNQNGAKMLEALVKSASPIVSPWNFSHEELAAFGRAYDEYQEKHGYYESVVHGLNALFAKWRDALPKELRDWIERREGA